MSTLASPVFNPFTFAHRLKEAGVPEQQAEAEAEAEALHEALAAQAQAVADLEGKLTALEQGVKRDAEQTATKGDVRELRMELKGDIRLLYWMLGTLVGLSTAALAGVVALVLKAYF